MLAIPTAFTRQTGEAHWHILVRARAIENGSFVFAAAQGAARERRRDLRPFAGGRSLGPHPGEGASSPAWCWQRSIRGRWRPRADGFLFAARRRFELTERRGAASLRGGRRAAMIRYALSCAKGHSFEAGSRIPRP